MKNNTEESILHPSKDAVLHMEMTAPGNEETIQENAVIDARKCMNAVKTIGSALVKSLEKPEKQSETFQHIIEEAGRVSRMLLLRWGHNPEDRKNRWMLNVVEKSLMPYLSSETVLPEDLVDRLASALVQQQTDVVYDTSWQKTEMIDMTIFSGVASLIKCQQGFNFGRRQTLDDDIQQLTNLVCTAAQNAVQELLPELTPHPERVTFYALMLEQLFELMTSSWNRNALKAQSAFAGLNKEQIKQWNVANPNGFALSPVEEMFQQNANRLLRLTVSIRKKK